MTGGQAPLLGAVVWGGGLNQADYCCLEKVTQRGAQGRREGVWEGKTREEE